MSIEERFAKNIKMLRKKVNITQKELAEAAGCSEKAVSKWECAQSIPDIEVLLSLSSYLKTTVEALFADGGKAYLLGIDGGGTKTVLSLAEADGTPIREICTDCSNPIDIGIERATEILKKGIYDICEGLSFSSVVCFAGIAGCTSGGMEKHFDEFFSKFGFMAYKADTDNANIIAAGLDSSDGITLILGTGVCSFLQKDGKRSQVGGRGYFIDNGGSAFDIGRDALITYYREKDGCGKKSKITLLMDKAGFTSPQNLLFHIYDKGKKYVASFAHFVYEAARIGDKTANDIIKHNMENAAIFVLANAEKLSTKKIPLILAGGLTNDPLTISYLKTSLGNKYDFDIRKLDCEPVSGAVRLAKKMYKETLKK